LRLALERGMPAAALLVLADAVLFPGCRTGARVHRRDTVYTRIAVGVTVLVAAHSAVALSLQIPATAATCALIAEIAAAQS
jgi:hypothetical protein